MASNSNQLDDSPVTDAVRLWRRLHGDRPGLLCVASAFFKHGTNGKGELVNLADAYFQTDQLNEAAAWVATQDRNGRECYFAVAQLVAPRRLKDNAAPTRVVHADLDGGQLDTCPIRPTAVVETSPGHHHVYWVLDRFVDTARAEELNKGMVRLIGADKGATDAVHLIACPEPTRANGPSGPT